MYSTDAGQSTAARSAASSLALRRTNIVRSTAVKSYDEKSDWTVLWAASACSWTLYQRQTDSWWVYLCRLHPTDRHTCSAGGRVRDCVTWLTRK